MVEFNTNSVNMFYIQQFNFLKCLYSCIWYWKIGSSPRITCIVHSNSMQKIPLSLKIRNKLLKYLY